MAEKKQTAPAVDEGQEAQIKAQHEAAVAAQKAAEGSDKTVTAKDGEAVEQVPTPPVTTSAAPTVEHPTTKAGNTGKAREVEPEPEVRERPVTASNKHFHVSNSENAVGVPMVQVLPAGWVGAAPLQIHADELDALIEALEAVRV